MFSQWNFSKMAAPEVVQASFVMLTWGRVAKCYRYDKYICVKILEDWGKKYRIPHNFEKFSIFWGKVYQLLWGFVFKPDLFDDIFKSRN